MMEALKSVIYTCGNFLAVLKPLNLVYTEMIPVISTQQIIIYHAQEIS